jgi:hypothetical protein
VRLESAAMMTHDLPRNEIASRKPTGSLSSDGEDDFFILTDRPGRRYEDCQAARPTYHLP